MVKRTSELASEAIAPKPKKIIGKMRVQGSFLPQLLHSCFSSA